MWHKYCMVGTRVSRLCPREESIAASVRARLLHVLDHEAVLAHAEIPLERASLRPVARGTAVPHERDVVVDDDSRHRAGTEDGGEQVISMLLLQKAQ